MKPLQIDFSEPSATRFLLRVRPSTWLLTCVGLGLCLSAALTSLNVSGAQQQLQEEQVELESKLSAHTPSRPTTKASSITESQAKTINGAIAQLNLPWQDMLDTMEASTPAFIALLALEPDGKKHVLKGTAEAKTGEDMLSYIAELKQQAFFHSVTLTKHEVNEQDPNKPLRFQFEAQWNAYPE